jgi:hypothetical protein
MAALTPLHWAGLTVIFGMSEARLILGIEMAGHRTRIREVLAGEGLVDEVRMFGGLSFMIGAASGAGRPRRTRRPCIDIVTTAARPPASPRSTWGAAWPLAQWQYT